MNARAPLAICSAVRTPFARMFGMLRGIPADELARIVLREALARAGASGEELDEVIVGCAGPPVEAMNLARVAALRAQIPQRVPAVTVHRNCASGLEAIHAALLRVRADEGHAYLVGGVESMSEAPFQLDPAGMRAMVEVARQRSTLGKLSAFWRARWSTLLPKPSLRAALTDAISGLLMGDTAEVLAREFAISREDQDAFAARSQERARQARDSGFLAGEIVPVVGPARSDKPFAVDDGIRDDATVEKLARLKPVFDRRFGTVTVGNACQVTDGGAAMLVASEAQAQRRSWPVLAHVLDVVSVGCDPRRMGLGPAVAIPALLARHGLRAADVDLFEINEAFAVQVLACLRQWGDQAPGPDRLNVNGGAIALGHPVGASGVRIVLTLARALRQRGLKRGIASLCVGGGQGVAALVEIPEGT
ncbi:MAG: thiolase family protein [Planctomycetes bacterium]|nr:thiolase family protein [Planctomycetota bacterium]